MFHRDIQAEEEFLRTYDASKWPHPSLTADICVFRCKEDNAWQVLLVQRGGHPFKGWWALPGGFSEPGEDIEQTALRELAEETHIQAKLERTYTYSGPDRDPRGWTATQVFVAFVDGQTCAQAGDDAAAACWFDIEAFEDNDAISLRLAYNEIAIRVQADIAPLPYSRVLRATRAHGDGLAFDHAQLITDAYLYMQAAQLNRMQ